MNGNTTDNAPTIFLRVEGQGRCNTCSWHVATQGHHPKCPGPSADPPKRVPRRRLPWDDDAYWKRCAAFLTPVNVKQPEPQRAKGDPWLEAAFRGVINDVANTPNGSRNHRLYWAARRLAELGLDETRCKQALMDASAHWNWSESGTRQCKATIKSGWAAGIANPKMVG
jgi:hypothetical protein